MSNTDVKPNPVYTCFCRALNLVSMDDVILAWNPFTHVSGFALNVFSICFGATTVFQEPGLKYKDFCDIVRTYNVSDTWNCLLPRLHIATRNCRKYTLRSIYSRRRVSYQNYIRSHLSDLSRFPDQRPRHMAHGS